MNESTYLLPFLTSVVVTAIAIHFIRPFATHIGLVDAPSQRKDHSGEVPLVGGVAMFIAFSITTLLFYPDLNEIREMILALSIIITVGVLDDHHEISVRVRFLFQIIVGIIMTEMAGVMLADLGALLGPAQSLSLGGWSAPFTVLAIIGVMNAMNMIDGIDGLAGMMALVTLTALQILFLLAGSVSFIALVVSGAIIAFLWYNLFSQHKIFMGDAGSMFLGLVIAWTLVASTQGEVRMMAPVTALWIFAVPLVDTVAIMVRRGLKGQSPFLPDREHLHHLFLRAGLSRRQTLLVVTGFALLFATVGVVGEWQKVPEWIMLLLFLTLFFTYVFALTHAWRLLKQIRKIF
ncbi:MAG: UDP-N-acetylglucosamine--undecaprenyl-phosphate N-acetylglucosaminephosphotransferase [Gammaproteobacteria bacterium]|nr:UDP-N-acetylglucosamine--undecaprenyl-phosphate N-acetylglucosaminephosphotransferase [Gammaproteobacteria bacterium]